MTDGFRGTGYDIQPVPRREVVDELLKADLISRVVLNQEYTDQPGYHLASQRSRGVTPDRIRDPALDT